MTEKLTLFLKTSLTLEEVALFYVCAVFFSLSVLALPQISSFV